VGTGLSLSAGTLTSTAGAIVVKDEGSTLTSAVTTFDFVGAGVVATAVGNAVTVTVNGGAAGGTVTNVTGVNANGFVWSIATSTTTPALTLSTSITGILQGNGTAISAASTTGSGNVVLATSPTLVTPLLGTPTSGTLTNCTLPYSGLTGSVPTWNQNTTGSAAKLTTARLIGGNSFDGTANIPLANNFLTFNVDTNLTGAQNIGLLASGLLYSTQTGSSSAVTTTDLKTINFVSLLGSGNITVGGTGTVTNTGVLTANTLMVGNGGADITSRSYIEFNNSLVQGSGWVTGGAPTLWGVINTNPAALFLSVPTTGPSYNGVYSSFYPSIGMTGGTSANRWASFIGHEFLLVTTSNALHESHFHGYTTLIGVPAGLITPTNPGVNWSASPAFTGGGTIPDPNYQEVSTFQGVCNIGSEGMLGEGLGIQLYDYAIGGNSTTSVAAPINAIVAAISKNKEDNSYTSKGISVGSNGVLGRDVSDISKITYWPYSAYYAYGGWQYGIDLSGQAPGLAYDQAKYNRGDIRFTNAHTISTAVNNLYINVNGSVQHSFTTLGLGVTGGITSTGNIGAVTFTGNITGTTGTAANANALQTKVIGTTFGTIPLNNGVQNPDLWAGYSTLSGTATYANSAGDAATLNAKASGNGSGQIPVSNGTQCTNLFATYSNDTYNLHSYNFTYYMTLANDQPGTLEGRSTLYYIKAVANGVTISIPAYY
jgi:hypothetical protein